MREVEGILRMKMKGSFRIVAVHQSQGKSSLCQSWQTEKYRIAGSGDIQIKKRKKLGDHLLCLNVLERIL